VESLFLTVSRINRSYAALKQLLSAKGRGAIWDRANALQTASPCIGVCLLLFLVLDALGLMFLSSPAIVYSAPPPSATPRRQPARPTTPTPTPRSGTRPGSPATNEFRVCNSNGIYSQTIQSAVDAAQLGDVIKVASGTYVESKPSVSANLYISKTVYVYGGYNCSDWTTQNPSVNISKIQPTTAAISVVDIEGIYTNTALVAPTLDGFTITGGGGGNHGGGIRIRDSNALISNNIITGNIAYLLGGGIWVQRGAPVIQNNHIQNNRINDDGANGGGIELESTQATLVGNTIANNVISSTFGYGGGIDVAGGGPVTITNNSILTNTAVITGTGYGGGASLRYGVTATLSNNLIQGNMANLNFLGNGGGIAIFNSPISLIGNSILSNTSSVLFAGEGGGLWATGSKVTLDSTRVQNNRAGASGDTGGGLEFVSSTYTLTNSIVSGNHANAGGGILEGAASSAMIVNDTFYANDNQAIQSQSPVTLTNSIILSHAVGVNIQGGATISATFSDFYNNITNTVGFALDSSNLLGNPDLDATFHLNSGSPAIDAGTHTNAPNHDIDGEPRAMIGASGLFRIDIGADERSGVAQRNINLDTTPADLTIIGPGNPLENPTSTGSNDWIGYSVLANDVTGDNRADLILAAEDSAQDFNTLNSTGRLFGLSNFGTRITDTIDLISASPNITVVPLYIRQHVGAALTSGDLNGDGKRDLIAGSYDNDNDNTIPVTPTVFVLWGSAALTGTRTLTNSTPADFMLRAPAQDFFAFSAKNALTTGDLNGNGVTDLIVGDYKANDGATPQSGASFVIFGRSTLSGTWDLAATPADFTLYGPGTNAHLGSVAVGRVNSDLQRDLVARTDTTAYVILGPLSSGSRHLISASSDITITNLQAGGLAVADITGDGRDDLILGSGSNIYVIPGPLTPGQTYNVTTAAAFKITGVTPSSIAVGNVTGDNKLDLILGDSSQRQAFVIPGGMNLPGTVAALDAAQMAVKSSSDNFRLLGYDVSAGDLDNDGQPDLVVSTWFVNVPSHPANFQDAGKVLVFYGNGGTGPPPLPPALYLPLIMK
jgi:FG-GAP repeat protein